MKDTRFFVVVLGWLTGVSLAQGQSQTPDYSFRQYVVELRLTNQSRPAKGLLYDLTDSTILLAPITELRPIMQTLITHYGGVLPPTDSLKRVLPLRTYRYTDVSRMNLHRRGRGALGALWAAGLGVVAGLTMGDDKKPDGFLVTTAGEKALVGVVYLPLPGALVGAATGRRIDRKKRSASIDVPRRFRKFAIVDQFNQAMLYADQPPTERPWTLSVTMAGWQGFGPTSAIKQRMKETGWASTEPKICGWFGCSGPTDYPFIYRRPIFDLDLGYRVSARRGYQLSVGMPHNAYVTGRRATGTTWIYVHNRIWTTSLRWVWFSRTGRWAGGAGPALLLFQTAQARNDYTPFTHRQGKVRPGLHLSGQYQLVNRQRWLLALKTDARLALPVYTQAYTVTDPYAVQRGKPVYRLPEANIAAFSLNLGLQAGLKFR